MSFQSDRLPGAGSQGRKTELTLDRAPRDLALMRRAFQQRCLVACPASHHGYE